MRIKIKKNGPYELQVIMLSYAAAAESIARVFNDNDKSEMSNVDLTRKIMKSLGFKSE